MLLMFQILAHRASCNDCKFMTTHSIYFRSILICFPLLCGGCGRDSDGVSKDGKDVLAPPSIIESLEVVAEDSDRVNEALRRAAENNQPEAQRELAKHLFFGDGMPANPTESIRWARRAALNGDGLASLWTGRAALNEPVDRIEAAHGF